jgi:hypothetical protein
LTGASPNPRDEKTTRNSSSRRKENFDDALEVAEALAEELGGVGIARRLYEKARKYLSREYLKRIEALEARQEELLQTNALLTRAGADYVVALDELREENERLLNQLREIQSGKSPDVNS